MERVTIPKHSKQEFEQTTEEMGASQLNRVSFFCATHLEHDVNKQQTFLHLVSNEVE